MPTHPDKEVSQVVVTAFSRHFCRTPWLASAFLTIQSPSTKGIAWSTACATIRDLMYIQRSFLRYIFNLQKHCPISSHLLPPKYSRSLDWMTLFLIETRDN